MEKIQEIVFQDNNEERDAIRCDVCKNLLSFPPILHNDALGNVCGRDFCAQMANSKGVNYRQSAYEALAKYLKFPCMYMKYGCCEILNWDQIEEHEKKCAFNTLLCPFSSDRFKQLENEVCPWTGETSALLEHLEEVHQAPHKFENCVEFHLGVDANKNQLFFSNIQNSIVVLLVVNDRKIFRLKVWSGHEIWRNIKYNVRFSTHRGQQTVMPKKQTTEPIHTKFFDSEVDDTWLTIDLDYIKKTIDSCKSFIIEFYFDGFLISAPQKLQRSSMTLFPTRKFYCDNCESDLAHPYFICENKHDICQDCKKTTNSRQGGYLCSLCHNPLFTKGKSTLEKLNFFIDKSFTTCFLCSENIDCLSSHLFNAHKESILQLDLCYSISLNTHFASFFSYDDHIFLLTLSSNKTDISFSVQCLDSRKIEYKFDLKLSDSKTSTHHAGMTYSNYCLPGYIDLNKISEGKHACSIPVEWLKDFIPFKGNIDIKLNISNI